MGRGCARAPHNDSFPHAVLRARTSSIGLSRRRLLWLSQEEHSRVSSQSKMRHVPAGGGGAGGGGGVVRVWRCNPGHECGVARRAARHARATRVTGGVTAPRRAHACNTHMCTRNGGARVAAQRVAARFGVHGALQLCAVFRGLMPCHANPKRTRRELGRRHLRLERELGCHPWGLSGGVHGDGCYRGGF